MKTWTLSDQIDADGYKLAIKANSVLDYSDPWLLDTPSKVKSSNSICAAHGLDKVYVLGDRSPGKPLFWRSEYDSMQ